MIYFCPNIIDMDILRLPRLKWTIIDSSLDAELVTFEGHSLTPADLDLFNRPIQLKTQNLILNLLPICDANTTQKIEFPTGPVVTPLQILGAIYTYYHIPLTMEELDLLDIDDELTRGMLRRTREDVMMGDILDRFQIMCDLILLESLKEEPDGSLTVELEKWH